LGDLATERGVADIALRSAASSHPVQCVRAARTLNQAAAAALIEADPGRLYRLLCAAGHTALETARKRAGCLAGGVGETAQDWVVHALVDH
jgi:hypothetical protein